MEMGSLTTSSILLLKQLSQNKEVKSVLYRLFHKLYKKLFLKEVQCVICEDITRINLNIDINDDNYIILNLESVYKSMSSDSENALISNLKLENYDLYCLKYSNELKKLLNAMRNEYHNKICIVLLSDIKMVEKLHIKNMKFIKWMKNYILKI
jgi:hypothetical protein